MEFYCLYSNFISVNCSIDFYVPFSTFKHVYFPIFMANFTKNLFFINIFSRIGSGLFWNSLFSLSYFMDLGFQFYFLPPTYLGFNLLFYRPYDLWRIPFCSIKADNTQTNGQNYVSTKPYLQKQAVEQIQQTDHSLPMPILDNRKKEDNLFN